MKRAATALLAITLLAACVSCNVTPDEIKQTSAPTAAPSSVLAKPSEAPPKQASPSPTIESTPTPEPLSHEVTIGFVGDIMLMQTQIGSAYQSKTEAYDFSRSFEDMAPLFQSVDIMCGNLEIPLAGAKPVIRCGRQAATACPPSMRRTSLRTTCYRPGLIM